MQVEEHRWYVIVTDGDETLVVHAGDGSGVVTFDNLEEFTEWEENYF